MSSAVDSEEVDTEAAISEVFGFFKSHEWMIAGVLSQRLSKVSKSAKYVNICTTVGLRYSLEGVRIKWNMHKSISELVGDDPND